MKECEFEIAFRAFADIVRRERTASNGPKATSERCASKEW